MKTLLTNANIESILGLTIHWHADAADGNYPYGGYARILRVDADVERPILKAEIISGDGITGAFTGMDGTVCIADEFRGGIGFEVVTFDVQFDSDTRSDAKGFAETYQYCRDYIDAENGRGGSYFPGYQGGTVSVVCNETGDLLYSTKVL